jgi:hypothetical protein
VILNPKEEAVINNLEKRNLKRIKGYSISARELFEHHIDNINRKDISNSLVKK